jgi:5'-3' exonuclease
LSTGIRHQPKLMEFEPCKLNTNGTKHVLLLFDGDILAYRAGFGAEKKVYFDKRSPPAMGGAIYTSKKDAKEHVEPEQLDSYRELEPVANALQNCKSMIENTIDMAATSRVATRKQVRYTTFLTGNKNFRMHVDSEYKANRKDVKKPEHLPAIRKYLQTHHFAQVSEGCEADDFFGQACLDAKKENMEPIVVSIDKDLNQIAGIHYNFVRDELYVVTERQADKVFWRQMLEGDRADNITGINQVGPKKAAGMIPHSNKETLKMDNDTAKEVVIGQYKKEFGDEWEEKYNKNCDLLWIWRKVPDECPFKT